MTREEALDNVRNESYLIVDEINDSLVVDCKSCINLIDKIYDDFKSTTCKNCKYSEYDNEKFGEENESNWLRCWNELIHTTSGRCVDVDFGCNKFEKKDKK